MFCKQKKGQLNVYAVLLVVILAIILIILGYGLLRNVFFPLILSAVWALVLKLAKNYVKNFFFRDEK
ncbi:hypothetical protein COX58_03415 [archaeon CG_4_10_14_0_2_um_filter_Archaea_38_6]|nr:MAG: hypothetical protein COS83_02975 [archaeon CG07_land_8_20_14_0_80_38_8]PIU88776.1 MAG: hypothetical protein COS64_02735 [archaeon CG06_land_8_20_14_3_00_37_11]PIX43191.1 MAG: hypothetical protein COZ55_01475 [archaeon CG_4_8_14_3_um_filter_38_5]PJA21799.1 MAG: hypothetical protein COX58_03415 [archaeon CG_4_10_14_0_2_um_filter_Archaea_38_6]